MSSARRTKLTRISPGFYDHQDEKCCCIFPVQQPRHHRVCLSLLTITFIISTIGIFSSSIASIASVSTGDPAWERIGRPSFPNDAAVFYLLGDNGELTYRECNGGVRWECDDCEYAVAVSDPTTTSTNISKLNATSPSSTLFGSSLSSSTNTRNNNNNNNNNRRAVFPSECDCGASPDFSGCPVVASGVSSILNCSRLEHKTEELYPAQMLAVGLGMGIFGLLWIAVLPVACCCLRRSEYKRPVAGFILLFFGGFIFPLILSVLLSQVFEKLHPLMVKDSPFLCNDGETLDKKGFRIGSILGHIYRSTVAQIFFAAGNCIVTFLGLCFIMFVSSSWFSRGSSCWCCYVYRYRPLELCCVCTATECYPDWEEHGDDDRLRRPEDVPVHIVTATTTIITTPEIKIDNIHRREPPIRLNNNNATPLAPTAREKHRRHHRHRGHSKLDNTLSNTSQDSIVVMSAAIPFGFSGHDDHGHGNDSNNHSCHNLRMP